jgi:isoleucyl-tRNA synthetase
MAPFLPFLTESIHLNLAGTKAGSVHLAAYPAADTSLSCPDMEVKMETVRQIVAMGRAIRSRHQIKNRQPLQELTVVIRDSNRSELVLDMASLIKDELNIKTVTVSDNEDSFVTVSAKPNFKKLGKAFGPQMKQAAVEIEKLTHAQIRGMEAGATVDVCGKTLTIDDIEIRRRRREGVEVETFGGITIGLNTAVSPELLQEGHAREIVNRIQTIRKNSDFNVTDRILVRIDCPDSLKIALAKHMEYICAETLSTDILWQTPLGGELPEPVEINGINAQIWVARAEKQA